LACSHRVFPLNRGSVYPSPLGVSFFPSPLDVVSFFSTDAANAAAFFPGLLPPRLLPLGLVPPVFLLATFFLVGIVPTRNASASGTHLQFMITQRARARTDDL
jgi:hypothetical protein